MGHTQLSKVERPQISFKRYQQSVSHCLIPKSSLLRRYLNLFAEESALDDAIYYLAEALRNDVINIQVFLRVRQS